MSMLLAPNQLRQMMGQYNIGAAAMFPGTVADYLSWTPAADGGDTWTLSAWVLKDEVAGNWPHILGVGPGNALLQYYNDDRIRAFDLTTSVYTTAKYRDTSAFHHVCLSCLAGVVTLEINGVDMGLGTTAFTVVNSAILHKIGMNGNSNIYFFKGYMAEIRWVSDQALVASNFIETDAITGKPVAKKFAGTYGTYGFYLDDPATGVDASGNGNNVTVNGTGITSVTSTPTDNSATANPLVPTSYHTFSNGNKTVTGSSAIDDSNTPLTFNIPKTGKYQLGLKVGAVVSTHYPTIGMIAASDVTAVAPPLNGTTGSPNQATASGIGAAIGASGRVVSQGTVLGTYIAYVPTDIMDVYIDADNGALYFGRNGTPQNSCDPESGASKTNAFETWTGGVQEMSIIVKCYNGAAGTLEIFAADMTTVLSASYTTLTTNNLPPQTATAKNLSKHFKTVLYNATAVNGNAVTGVGFQPGFVAIKNRDVASRHAWYDVNRGVTNWLDTSSTDIEVARADTLVSFDADGFTVDADASGWGVNTAAGNSHVAHCFSLPNTVTNGWSGSPTITPTKEIYNADLGMSIVTFTGNGTAGATIPHSLGVKPGLVVIKERDAVGPWTTYHSSLGATKAVYLNTTAAAGANIVFWNNTEPTNALVSLGVTTDLNGLGGAYVAYIFAESDFIKIGSYVGNGSIDGPYINNGTSPVWSLTKLGSGINSWHIHDGVRPGYNGASYDLYPDLSNAEAAPGSIEDFTSMGFKIRNITGAYNTSGGTLLYMTIGQPI